MNNQEEDTRSSSDTYSSSNSVDDSVYFRYTDDQKTAVVKEKKSGIREFLDLITSMLIIFIAGLAIREFVLKPFTVNGQSMEPTLHTNDYLFIDQLSYEFSNPGRGDIVVFNPPLSEERDDPYIKRVIALPGEYIEINSLGEVLVFDKDGDIFRMNEDYTQGMSDIVYPKKLLEKDEYFVMGDNRLYGASLDSRRFHAVKKDDIIGKAFFRLYPFDNAGFLNGKPILEEITR